MRHHSLFLSIALVICPASLFGQTQIPIRVEIRTPKGWEKSGSTGFVIRDFDQELRSLENELKAGHQPWRLDPLNAAASCLWNFGIQDGTAIFEFAKRLVVVKPGEQYAVSVGSKTYTVSIRTQHSIPIAFELAIK